MGTCCMHAGSDWGSVALQEMCLQMLCAFCGVTLLPTVT